ESILSATSALQSALDGDRLGDVATIAAGGLLVVFAMWWLYFSRSDDQLLAESRAGDGPPRVVFAWGYLHYVLFAAAAAVGAGLPGAVARAVGEADVSARYASATVAVPVAVFLVMVWLVHSRGRADLVRGAPVALTACAVVACAAVGHQGVLAVGVVVSAL